MHAILDLTLNDLESHFKKRGFTGFAARQVFHWIYKKAIYDFNRMTNLSVSLRNFLNQNFHILSFSLDKKQLSSDGTEKFLFSLYHKSRSCAQGQGKQGIESALIPELKHLTFCISTQVGCKFACRFCASGAQGWQRDLTSGQIIEQVIHLKDACGRRPNNLVFMGVGEPLDNYDNLLKAVRILNSPYSFNIGARKMTISTCGLIPGIKKLSKEGLQIELSISLHAADNQTRTYLMPINNKYPLEKLLSACRSYFKKTRRQITFEYVLIKGINSDLKQAGRLTKLLAGMDAKVNLIALSPFKNGLSTPNKLEILLFKDILIKAGLPATVRRPRGADIQAACGQLRLRNLPEAELQTATDKQ